MTNASISAISGLVGALIGGGITYVTVRQQLQHASNEARLTREHELRRQVYLEAAEGIARGCNYLARISDSGLPIQELSSIPAESGAWVYRVHLVGNLNTIKVLDQANESLFHHALDLLVKRMRWEELRSEAASVYDRTTQAAASALRLGEALQAISTPGATSEAHVLAPQMAEKMLALLDEQAEDHRKWEQVSSRQDQAHRDLVATSWKARAEQDPLVADAIIHLRRELDIAIDEKAYLGHVEQSSQRSLERLEDLLSQIEQLGTD